MSKEKLQFTVNSTFTPRNLRRGQHSSPGNVEKKKAFRRAKQWSDRFIHLKASQLFRVADAYEAWCVKANGGQLRK